MSSNPCNCVDYGVETHYTMGWEPGMAAWPRRPECVSVCVWAVPCGLQCYISTKSLPLTFTHSICYTALAHPKFQSVEKQKSPTYKHMQT